MRLICTKCARLIRAAAHFLLVAHSWVKITRKQHSFCVCHAIARAKMHCLHFERFFYFHRTFSPLRQRISFFRKVNFKPFRVQPRGYFITSLCEACTRRSAYIWALSSLARISVFLHPSSLRSAFTFYTYICLNYNFSFCYFFFY